MEDNQQKRNSTDSLIEFNKHLVVKYLGAELASPNPLEMCNFIINFNHPNPLFKVHYYFTAPIKI